MKTHIIFLFEEIKAGELQKLGEGPKHISEDCIQQCAMLCLNIPGTHNSLIAVITDVNQNTIMSLNLPLIHVYFSLRL